MSPKLKACFQRIETMGDEAAAITSKLVAIESVRPDFSCTSDPVGPGVRQCLAAAVAMCESRGMAVRIHDGQVAVAEIGAGQENLAFVVHLDVVPAGQGWTYPPFSGAIVDGYVWGRGAQDDKGPFASILVAIDALQAELTRRYKTGEATVESLLD